MPSAVSFRYARALADTVGAPMHSDALGSSTVGTPGAGRAATNPEAIASQLAEFQALLSGSGELRILFSTPAVIADKKKAVLAELAKAMGLEPVTRNFLSVVIDHDRMGLLGEITEAFEALLNERLGIAVAEVTAARPLEEAEKQELTSALAAKTGKQIRLNFSLDASLIGGVVARVGSTIYDGSVRGHLRRLRAELVGK